MNRVITAFFFFFTLMALGQSIDPNFEDPLPIRAAKIEDVHVQPDGKILLGGDIAFYEEQRVHNLIRLNADGSLDASFAFNYDGAFVIRELEVMSNGNIVALLRKYESARFLVYDETILLTISPAGTVLHERTGLLLGNAIAVQPDNKVLVAGYNYLKRYSGTLQPDETFNGAVSFNGVVTDIQVFDEKLYAAGMFSHVNGIVKHDVVRLNLNGTVDNTFDTGEGTEDYVGAITIQTDGKILLGNCYINQFNGRRGSGMLRLNTNGSVDETFVPPYLNGGVSRVIARPGGELYAAAFLNYQDVTSDRFFKLLPSGELDESFNPIFLNEFGSFESNPVVTESAIMLDNSSDSGNLFGFSRFNLNATLDESFMPEVSRFGTIIIGDFYHNKLIVAGDFIRINGFETFGIARLNMNGSLDETFALTENKGAVKQVEILDEDNMLVSTYKNFFKLDASGSIRPEFHFEQFDDLYQIIKFIVLPDGKIMVADPNNIHRLNADASEDESFDVGTGIDDIVSTGFDFDMQRDKVIYGSMFTLFNGQNVNRLIRLNTDGSIDQTFDPGTGPVDMSPINWSMASLVKVLNNDEILVGGFFTHFDDQLIPHGLVKLDENGALDQEFNENQMAAPAPAGVFFLNNQIEQVGSRIFIRQNNTPSLYVIRTNGTVDTDFTIPSHIDFINHLISTNQLPNGGRSTQNQEEIPEELFALGLFQQDGKANPSFILRLAVGESITGLGDKSNKIIERVYPNAFTDQLNVTFAPNFPDCNLTIQDFSGKTVKAETMVGDGEQQIDMRGAPAGVYFLKATTTSGHSQVVKVIKAK